MTSHAESPGPRADMRASGRFLLGRSVLGGLLRRLASILALAAIDILGLAIGLYLALALRALVRDPKPVLWNLLWDEEAAWLPFLVLLMLLVFWRNRLYSARESREGAGHVVPSALLVAALALAFALGTGQEFTTFGLYPIAAVLVAAMISLFRGSYEVFSGAVMRSYGVRRRVLLVGNAEQVAHLRATLGSSRGGIDYAYVGTAASVRELEDTMPQLELDELIIADGGLPDEEVLEVVESAHRRGVRVRIAPRTTELLIEQGEYVPGQAMPLFELRAPTLAGVDWALKRAFDLTVSALLIVVGLPFWLLIAVAIKLGSRGPVFYADSRIGLRERPFRMLKFRTMIVGAADLRAGLEDENEAGGALFKIRDDPRVTRVGRVLRRLSIDEVPNVINVLRGEMSLVGPRPLPTLDYDRLEGWHRRRSNVLPGVTGLWQIAGRSDLSVDDLVRLDFYYLENWSLWLDITILVKTMPAVIGRKGAY